MGVPLNVVCIVMLAAAMVSAVRAQDSTAVRISGSIGASYDIYNMTSTGSTATFARRPASIFRLFADPTFSVGDWLSIPVSISFTFREAAVIQPSFDTPDLSSFLQNPLNRLSISPRIGFATLHLGSIVPRYGSLTVDNAQLFGIGFDVKPSAFRIQGSYGTLFRAVPADTVTGRNGSYARTLWAVRVGNDDGENSRVGVTVAYMNDDEGSIPFFTQETIVPVPILDSNGIAVRDSAYSLTQRSSLLGLPQEGMTLGIDFRSGFGEGFHVGGEFAATAFTRDKSAPELEDPIPVIGSLMTTRSSTRTDGAAKLELGYRSDSWGATGGVQYIGPGYVVLTQPYFQPDHIDISLSPYASFIDGRLVTNATVGLRFTDVSSMLAAGSTQMLISINATGTITESLLASASFTNFGYRTTRAADTMRYEQVSNSFSLAPSYILSTEAARHTFGVSVSLDAFSDVTQPGVPSAANTTTSLVFLYGLSPTDALWSGRASFSMVDNDLQTMRTTMQSASVFGSYRFLGGDLEPDAGVIYSQNEIAGLPAESQLTIRVGARGKIVKSFSLQANVQWTSVDSQEAQFGRAYSELMATLGARWIF